jgi:NTE family protein
MSPLKIGVALGSGAGRGWAHIGALRALERAGLTPQVVAGTSVGALVGGLYAAGMLDRLEKWARDLNTFRIFRLLDLRPLSGGFVGGEKLLGAIRENLGTTTIEALPRNFVAVSTDLVTGHEVWLREGMVVDALHAAFALPGIFAPVNRGGRWLVDGALVNPVPVSVCRALGCQLVVAINLNGDVLGKKRDAADALAPAGYDMFERIVPAAGLAAAGAIPPESAPPKRAAPSAPNMLSVMVASLNIIQDRLSRSRLAGDPPDVLIAPRIGHIGLLEFDRAGEAIEEGAAAVERALPTIRDAVLALS